MSATWQTIIGFCIGIGAYTVQSIGKGFHKLGINKMILKAGPGNRLKQSGTWIMGTVLMAVYMVSQWIALLLTPVNVIAPLDGLSLVVLLLFSWKVLKEPITAPGILGAALVIAGTVLSALAFKWNASTVLVVPDQVTLFLVNMIIPIVGCLAVAIAVKVKSRLSGVVAGLVAGILIAMETISKRLSSVPDTAISATFSALAILYAVGSLTINQVGYAKGMANVVVPCATSTSVIFAIILGLVLLGETVNGVQVLGMALIIPGIVLLTTMDAPGKAKAPCCDKVPAVSKKK